MGINEMPPRAEGHLCEAACDSPRRFLLRGIITIAEAGVGQTNLTTIITMNTSNLSLANRKQLADMLSDHYGTLRYKAKEQWNVRENELTQTCLLQEAERMGATKVIDSLEKARAQVERFEAELAEYGLESHDTGLETIGSSNPLDSIVRKHVRIAIGSKDAIDSLFDEAHLAMMTVETLQEAREILKGLPQF